MSSENTDRLGLPYLMPAQAQKHVTVNESLRAMDAIIHLSVLDRDLTAQPVSPSNSDAYILPSSPTGDDWSGFTEHDVVVFTDDAWMAFTPVTGWRAHLVDEGIAVVFDGTDWVDEVSLIGSLNNLSLLGVGTTADGTNPFSARLNKALWTALYDADGGTGDLRYTLNKEAAPDTVSLLFQTGFSGRAEIGLTGDDDLTFKVSANGSSWKEAIRITAAGQVGFGTTNPEGVFHFASNGNAGNTFLFEETDGGPDEKKWDFQAQGGAFVVRAINDAVSGSNAFLRFERNGLARQAIRLGDEDLNIDSNGQIGIQTQTPTVPLDINGDAIRIRTSQTPASASDTGDTGTIVWDSDYLYVCVASDTWKRAALSSW